MENSTAPTATVQHVPKASSDELLNKFAEMASPKRDSRLSKRLKRTQTTSSRCCSGDNPCLNSIVEKKSLLPPASTRRRSSALLIRQLGRGRVNVGSKAFKNRSILGTIEKTWRKTVEGATKVFVEKHYNRHKRLINDIA